MAGLKDIRNRISSVKSTKQITSAMKMVAAAKLKKAQDRVLQIRPYADKMRDVLAEVSSSLDKNHASCYGEVRKVEKVLVVLMASNRGLCGGFNSNICKKAMAHVKENYPAQLEKGNVKFICLGKKAYDFILKQKFEIVAHSEEIFDKLNFATAAEIAEPIMKDFVDGKYDKVDLVYNSFKNAASQELKIEPFLPFTIEAGEGAKKSDYIFEPTVDKIVDDMIPKSMKIQFFKSVLDSFAAEQGARMTAMHQATDNATELIKTLTLMYNKARQAAITNELSEITSGAEALKG
ncbi:MAG: ATP synthase F1 subunit gamma [Bacteroidales bacterium]|nr:ATP synthase F1 subunit gamma [Bacteroidales bacterium]